MVWSAIDNDLEMRFALDRICGGRELEGRSITRRVRSEYGTVILWESLSTWQSARARKKKTHVLIHESGCSIIAPAAEDPDNVSVGYCGKSFRMESADGSCLEKSDPIVQKIVDVFQEFQLIHMKRVENIAVNTNLQAQGQVTPT